MMNYYKKIYIIRHVRDGTTWYLCKWRDLGYDQATWESDDTDIVDMDNMIDQYHIHRLSSNFIVVMY